MSILHLIFGLARATDQTGSILAVPNDQRFRWEKGLALLALAPVAISVPTTVSNDIATIRQKLRVLSGNTLEGTSEVAGGPETFNLFLEKDSVVRASDNLEVIVRAQEGKAARFQVIRGADFDY